MCTLNVYMLTVFVTDGEHVVEDNDKENLRTAMENLQNLRNDGHEAFAIIVSQGQKYAADYNVIEELFSTSLKGERNLYFVENYEGLAEMNSALNLTGWTEDYAAQCKFYCQFIWYCMRQIKKNKENNNIISYMRDN